MLREGSGECREVGLAQNHQSALRVAHGLDHALPHGQNAAFHQTDTSEGGCYTPTPLSLEPKWLEPKWLRVLLHQAVERAVVCFVFSFAKELLCRDSTAVCRSL